MDVSPLQVIGYRQDQLNRLYEASETGPIDCLVNSGARRYDIRDKIVFNDTAWKGYFPVGQILSAVANRIHAGFRKRFFRENGILKGVTSDSDFFIRADNTVEEVVVATRNDKLRPGSNLLLKYTDLRYRAFYDLLKVINKNLLIGKVFMGLSFPDGIELFTFAMVREYSFDEMTVEDHRELYELVAVVPDLALLGGNWTMSAVANSTHRQDVAQLAFDVKPDGRVEGRYLFVHTLSGQMEVEKTADHLQLVDFTPLHDEIRAIDANYMLGKWISDQRVPFGPFSLGLLQAEPAGPGQSRYGFYYTLRRTEAVRRATAVFLDRILNRRLGVGLTFNEQMDGRYYAGDTDRRPEHLQSLKLEDGKACQFNVTMTIADLDMFVASPEHRAELAGTIQFAEFRGDRNVLLQLEPGSFFNYLVLNPATEEREMRYHIRFMHRGAVFVLDGRKYMQRDRKNDIREILEDYTTLFVQVIEEASGELQGVALMKFRTFESVAALVSMAQFGLSFTVTGTDNPAVKAAALTKFNALTTRFVFHEYNPLGF